MITPAPLMRLLTGFWSFKTFAAAIDFDLFTKLAGGRTVTVQDVTKELGLAERPADLLLAACASLGLLDRTGDGYRNSALAEEFLVTGRPYYYGGHVRYCDKRTYLAWHRVDEALRTNRPVTWDPQTQESLFGPGDPEMVALFWEAMYSTSIFTARTLAEAYDFSPHRRLLDVGGGAGAFPIELRRHHPELRATILDLPHVCALAEKKIAAAGFTGSIDAVAGNFLVDPALPTGYDIMLLSMILHDWDESTNRMILRKCYEALPSGGTVIVSELLLDDDRSGPPEAALMGMNMLIETEGGKNYSGAEYVTWLTESGFGEVRRLSFDAPGANGAVVARKP